MRWGAACRIRRRCRIPTPLQKWATLKPWFIIQTPHLWTFPPPTLHPALSYRQGPDPLLPALVRHRVTGQRGPSRTCRNKACPYPALFLCRGCLPEAVTRHQGPALFLRPGQQLFQFGDNPGGVAPGPVEAPAAGAPAKLCLAVVDVFRDNAQGRLPGHRGEEVVTFPAAAQRRQVPAAYGETQNLRQLFFRALASRTRRSSRLRRRSPSRLVRR